MKNKILLTVIVPVYNLEKYIGNCIDSLLNQSFHDMEILVIDDASTDRTYELLKEYQNNYNNIQLIRNEINKGVSYCRNYGLSLVKTKYVAFLDGDDWIDSNCYSKAINKLEADKRIDIALWNINTVYSRTHCLKRYFYDEENNISSKYALRLFSKSLNSNIYISPLLGNKVIRMQLLTKNNIKFHGYFYEDDIFIFKCLLFANSIQLVTNAHLYYFQRDNSVMHSFSEQMVLELFEEFSKFRAYLIENNTWSGNEQNFYSYYEKCIQNLLLIMRNTVATESEERNMLFIIYKEFYSSTPLKEYSKYCDLKLFPF